MLLVASTSAEIPVTDFNIKIPLVSLDLKEACITIKASGGKLVNVMTVPLSSWPVLFPLSNPLKHVYPLSVK